jgi:hypothetical protein
MAGAFAGVCAAAAPAVKARVVSSRSDFMVMVSGPQGQVAYACPVVMPSLTLIKETDFSGHVE